MGIAVWEQGEGAYFHKAEYWGERVEMMEWWGRLSQEEYFSQK